MHFLEYYDHLLKISKDICHENQNWSSITKLPQEHVTFIYFIILHDYIINGGEEKQNPYGCKVQMGGRGVLTPVHKLPERLQKILVAYLAEISN